MLIPVRTIRSWLAPRGSLALGLSGGALGFAGRPIGFFLGRDGGFAYARGPFDRRQRLSRRPRRGPCWAAAILH
jgi:hypothetical protein